jgi:hypothetical protein
MRGYPPSHLLIPRFGRSDEKHAVLAQLLRQFLRIGAFAAAGSA